MVDFFRRWIRDFFGFSAREVNGFLILLPLMLIILASEPVYHWYVSQGESEVTIDVHGLDSLLARMSLQETKIAEKRDSLFHFDPNKESAANLERLGFSGVLAKRLVAYREKGGVFRTRRDLLKIYGMDSALVKRLNAYVILPEKLTASGQPQTKKDTQSTKAQFSRVDINTADTTSLKSVYGVGTKLAARIVKFRDALGGFVRMEQLKEVYGLDSVVIGQIEKRFFIAETFIPHQLNVNTAHEQELSAHPYIRKTLAKAIVSWRFQHGNFTSANDLEKLKTTTPDNIRKLSPYLKFED